MCAQRHYRRYQHQAVHQHQHHLLPAIGGLLEMIRSKQTDAVVALQVYQGLCDRSVKILLQIGQITLGQGVFGQDLGLYPKQTRRRTIKGTINSVSHPRMSATKRPVCGLNAHVLTLCALHAGVYFCPGFPTLSPSPLLLIYPRYILFGEVAPLYKLTHSSQRGLLCVSCRQ